MRDRAIKHRGMDRQPSGVEGCSAVGGEGKGSGPTVAKDFRSLRIKKSRPLNSTVLSFYSSSSISETTHLNPLLIIPTCVLCCADRAR
jgi:hypothetical protein